MSRRRRPDPDLYVANFQARVLHDAWLEATARFWERRARELEAARPRRGDFAGAASLADIAARWTGLTEAAQACRSRADMAETSRTELLGTLRSYAAGQEGAA